MTKFNAITAILALIIFTITGEAQDPLPLRLAISATSAAMLSTFYCALAGESTGTKMITILAASLIAATLADPDPSTLQILLAFVGAPIITAIAIRSEQEKKHETETVVEPTHADQGSEPPLHL